MRKIGVLLINLGTPAQASTSAIRRYLFEFLRDKRVIDLPRLPRFLLIVFAILPFRPRRIRAAYQQIYTAEGSPLAVHSNKLARALQEQLGSGYMVRLAMRYGKPSISMQLAELAACDFLKVVLLYPHYAASSTGTALAEVYAAAGKSWHVPELAVIPAFYQHPGFIRAWCKLIAAAREVNAWDFLLFSYHGLPKRHLHKSACTFVTTSCSPAPCPLEAPEVAAQCYRYQCYASTRLLAAALGLAPSAYGVSFQSRLGRTPWIEPFTDEYLPELYQRGIRNLAVVSPSFVSDCLETLEEIAIRLREQWLAYPGTTFTPLACLNDHPQWVRELAAMVRT